MKKAKFIFIFILIIILIIIYHNFFRKETTEIKQLTVDKSKIKIEPVKVKVQNAFMGNLIQYITATGITEAINKTQIRSLVAGNIKAIYITEGQYVQKGTPLAKIDDIIQKSNLELAKNNLIKAQCQYIALLKEGIDTTKNTDIPKNIFNKYYEAVKNFKQNKIDKEKFNNIKREYELAIIKAGLKRKEILLQRSGLKQAEIEYEKAKYYYDNCIIRAPYDGIIGNINVHRGDYINTNHVICSIVDLSKLKFKMKLMESDIGYVKKGDSIKISFVAFPKEYFLGKIIGIEPSVDTISRTLTAVAYVDNDKFKLKSGMFGTTKIAINIFKNRLLVPRAAVLIRDQRKLVFIVRDGKANWCYVKTGKENDEYVEIVWSAFDLKPGEPVIVDGHFALAHNSPVYIINQE